jgi:hypothetical protein
LIGGKLRSREVCFIVTEEATFKKLQGLTREEAEDIHARVYDELLREHESANPSAPKPWNSAISISELRERVDKELLPYGWSFDKVVRFNMDNIS